MRMRHRHKSAIRWKLWISVIFAIAVGFFFFSGYFCTECNEEEISISELNEKNCSFEKILDYYGFETPEKQNALKELFIMSSLASENDSWEKIFPPDQRIANILNFVTNTQWKFSNRFGRERWEVSEQPWMTDNREKIIKDLDILGFLDEVNPSAENYDAVCVLGASAPRMAMRLQFVTELLQKNWVKTSTIVLLSGERYVNNVVDGSSEELQAIAAYFGLDDWHKLTEAKVFDYLYEKSPLKNMGLNIVIIDTPKGMLPRPTTKTTIAEFKKWLRENPNVTKLLFVSNQPYLLYQEKIIQNELYLDEKGFSGIKIEMVGPGVSDPMVERIQTLLEGLGSYIWAASPLVLKKLFNVK